MSMYKCPVCGELFSTSYKKCPFCEEDDLLLKQKPKQNTKQKNRHHSGNEPRVIGPALIVVIILAVALIVFLCAGDKIFGSKDPGTSDDPGVVDPANSDENDEGDEEPDKPFALDITDKELTVGDTLTLVATGGSGEYTWSSGDSEVASVDESGKVTALAKGEATITVTDGTDALECAVTVKAKAVPFTLGKTDVTIKVGEKFNVKASGENLTYKSADTSKATVDQDGTVTAVAKGQVIITVSNGSETKECIVRIR